MTRALEYALKYAEQGWPVFPLNGKVPATPNGFKDATRMPGIIKEWFEGKERNIGVAIPEGFWVLDVDPRNGGWETWLEIRNQLPNTRSAETGGGGLHFWYQGEAPKVRLRGIDIKKGGTGYVVVPPSIHACSSKCEDPCQYVGNPYKWAYEVPIAPFSGPLRIPGSQDTGELLTDVLGGSGEARSLAEGTDPIPSGKQHETLVQIAGHVLSLYPPAIARKLFDDAVNRCEPAHPESEAERIWRWTLERQAEGDGFVQSDGSAGSGDDPDSRQTEIEREVAKLEIREEAKKLLRERKALAEWSTVRDDVPFKSLKERLDEFNPDEQVEFVVEDLLATYGNVVFSAQDKAGKTTFSLGLVKALADGGKYLNKFEAKPIERNVCYMNVELAAHTADKWFTDLHIENAHKVQTLYLRGQEQWFAIESPEVRRHVAEAFKARDIGVLIVDPIGPLWDAAGINENENSEVGPYMVLLGQLAVAANIDNLIVVQHAGHGGERARGASKILGWPDAVWSIRKASEGAEERRFFKAYGRDVDVPEAQFTYDHETRGVTLLSQEEMASKRGADILEAIRAAVVLEPGITSSDLRKVIKGDTGAKTRWIDSALSEGLIHSHEGPRNARLYHPNSGCELCSSL